MNVLNVPAEICFIPQHMFPVTMLPQCLLPFR